jgi:hypothetical protein
VSLLPQHLGRLRDDLEVHESRISGLRKQVSMLEDEITVHDWIVRLDLGKLICRAYAFACRRQRGGRDDPSPLDDEKPLVPLTGSHSLP